MYILDRLGHANDKILPIKPKRLFMKAWRKRTH